MILADKIIEERKKNGWSQEELAEKLDVSRQSVSKWEGAQSTPDLQKILKLSRVFGVSTEYLLKDEIESAEYIETSDDKSGSPRNVSMEEANKFLSLNEKFASRFAFATLLCIISPVALFLLGGLAEAGFLNEDIAGAVGMLILFIIVAYAVANFIIGGRALEEYEYLEKEEIETAYGVDGMVKERKEKYSSPHTKELAVGTVICILGVAALFLVPLINDSDLFGAIMFSIMIVLEAIGVFIIVRTANIDSGYDKLLQRGDYTVKKKKAELSKIICTVYLLFATAVFFVWGFFNDWSNSWIVWAVAGILYPAVSGIAKLIDSQK